MAMAGKGDEALPQSSVARGTGLGRRERTAARGPGSGRSGRRPTSLSQASARQRRTSRAAASLTSRPGIRKHGAPLFGRCMIATCRKRPWSIFDDRNEGGERGRSRSTTATGAPVPIATGQDAVRRRDRVIRRRESPGLSPRRPLKLKIWSARRQSNCTTDSCARRWRSEPRNEVVGS